MQFIFSGWPISVNLKTKEAGLNFKQLWQETFSELSLAAILWEVVMAVCLESGVNPWYEDQNMKEDLKRYVQQNLKRKEILDFMKRDYAMYCGKKWPLTPDLHSFSLSLSLSINLFTFYCLLSCIFY